ncbi:unnamed protein product [Durusdinium trenchii]|uniref:AB hydrolase-1 domain-containing protein n=1 Tax=Durusdinium trenchii TaxID=1381693 RepID=A0ABP0JMC9_9DINO
MSCENISWRSGQELLKQATLVEVRPGRKLRVLRQEPREPKMPTCLLVHGSAASLTQYLALAEALKTLGYGVVCYDWLGCGLSDKPDHWESYAFDELLYDLKAIWDAKWPGKYFVVGHSFGSHLVLRLGAMLADTMLAGDTIAGLILLGAAKQFPEGHPIFRLPVFVLQWLQPSLTKAFLQMALASNDPELIQQETDGCNANPMYMCKAYYRQVRNVSDDEIAKCRGQDGIVSASDVEALAVAMPLAQMKTVANAGHVPMLEEPGKVAELIDEFIKSI